MKEIKYYERNVMMYRKFKKKCYNKEKRLIDYQNGNEKHSHMRNNHNYCEGRKIGEGFLIAWAIFSSDSFYLE